RRRGHPQGRGGTIVDSRRTPAGTHRSPPRPCRPPDNRACRRAASGHATSAATVTGGGFGTPRRLTSGERARLAQLVILIAAPSDAQRHHAIAAAVAAARDYRRSGVAWDEIASALGVSTDELRTWRGTAPRANTTLPASPSSRAGWEWER